MNKFHRLVRFGMVLAALVGLATLLPSQLQAQDPSVTVPYFGSVVGIVTNASKAVIPNATVHLINLTFGEVRTQTTDANGKYEFLDLLPDEDYKLTVELPNYKPFVRESFRVASEAVVRVNPVMTNK